MLDSYSCFENWFCDIDKTFADFADFTLDKTDVNKRRIFIDNGAHILFVAHVDTVCKPELYGAIENRIYASGLDDRLGCYTAFVLSQQLKADVLLTDREESGQSTAKYHDCKEYNWVAEFDRAGDDFVTYNLDSAEFLKAAKKYFRQGMGSFSDISSLATKVCCINIGIGYKDAHSQYSYFELNHYKQQMAKFCKFYHANKDKKYVQDYSANIGFGKYSHSSFGYDWHNEKRLPKTKFMPLERCDICNAPFEVEDWDLIDYSKGVICDDCLM